MSSSRARVCRGKLLTDSGLLNQMASGESLKPEEENLCGDRFSSLPDALAYLILSFVDLEDFARLLAVSRRWKHLSLSAPYLSMVNDASRLQGSLDYYFSKRGKEHKIEQLRVVCTKTLSEKPKRDQNRYGHPVFRYLRKCLESYDPKHVEFTLKSVKISSKCLRDMISQLCCKLKVLRLYECSGLKRLVILNDFVEHLEIIQEKCCKLSSITVYCLNLKTLSITCYPESFTGPKLNLKMHKVAHFELKGFPPRYYGDDCEDDDPIYKKSMSSPSYNDNLIYQNLKSATIYCIWPIGRNLDQGYSSFLLSVVKAIRETKSLRLLARTIEILFSQLSEEEVQPSIEGVETLYIDDCYLTDDEVPAIAFMLKMMRNLKSLSVSLSSKAVEVEADLSKKKEEKREVSGFKMDYWEAQNLKFVQQLKTATFVICEEGNATELVNYFAKHGEHLRSLQVLCPRAMVFPVCGQMFSLKCKARSWSAHAIK